MVHALGVREVKPQALLPFVAPLLPIWFFGSFLGQDVTVEDRNWSFLVNGKLNFNGMVLYGGLLLTFLAGRFLYFLQRWKTQVDFDTLFDTGMVALGIVISFGRMGCFLNGCCYGLPSGVWPGFVIPAATSPGLSGLPLHPAPLYESLGMALITSLALVLTHRRLRAKPFASGTVLPAVAGWLVLLGYAVLRFSLEFIRGDERGGFYGGLSPSQWISVAIVSFAFFEVPRTFRRILKERNASLAKAGPFAP
jgi:phosphatidylglycerol:prolipoprotein diacylglycerol transferase